MEKKIDDELLEQRIKLYMEENWDVILSDIDKRVEKMMSKIIRELFTDTYRSPSVAQKLLKEKVESVTAQVVEDMKIEKEEIKRLAQKKLENQVKKLKFEIQLN